MAAVMVVAKAAWRVAMTALTAADVMAARKVVKMVALKAFY